MRGACTVVIQGDRGGGPMPHADFNIWPCRMLCQ